MQAKEYTLFMMAVKALKIVQMQMMNNCINNLDSFKTKKEKMTLTFMMRKMILRWKRLNKN